jgi:hypothetical protein
MATSLPSELDVGGRSAPSPAGPVSMEAPGTAGYGIQAQNLQKSASSMGMAADTFYRARESWAAVSADDAANKLAEKFAYAQNNPEKTGWIQKELGLASAPDYFGKTVDSLEGIYKSITDTITDPLVRQKFSSKGKAMLMMQKSKVLMHQGSERSKYDTKVANNTVDRSLQDVVAVDVNSHLFASTFQYSLNVAEGAIAELMLSTSALNDEEGRKFIQAATQTVRDQFMEAVLEKALAEDKAVSARQLWNGTHASGLPAFSKALSSKVAQRLRGKINDGVDESTATAAVSAAWVKFAPPQKTDGSFDFNAPVRTFEMEEQLSKDLADNPEALKKAITLLRTKASAFNQQQSEMRDSNASAVEGALYVNGETMQQVRKMKEWGGLAGYDQARITTGFESYQAARASRLAGSKSDQNAINQQKIYQQLVGHAYNYEKSFLNSNVDDWVRNGLIDKSLIAKMIALQSKIRGEHSGQSEEKLLITSAMSQVKSMTDAVFGTNEKSDEYLANINGFTGAFATAIDDWRKLNRKAPNSTELREIAKPLLLEVSVHGRFFNSDKFTFDLQRGDVVEGIIDMPKNAFKHLQQAFKDKYGRLPDMKNSVDAGFFYHTYITGEKKGTNWDEPETPAGTGYW